MNEKLLNGQVLANDTIGVALEFSILLYPKIYCALDVLTQYSLVADYPLHAVDNILLCRQ